MTGAGGSIGRELCKQIIKFLPAKLIMIDQSEENLYQIENDIKSSFTNPGILKTVLGNVCDQSLIRKIFIDENMILFISGSLQTCPIVENNPIVDYVIMFYLWNLRMCV